MVKGGSGRRELSEFFGGEGDADCLGNSGQAANEPFDRRT
jgi:hypothetical protein